MQFVLVLHTNQACGDYRNEICCLKRKGFPSDPVTVGKAKRVVRRNLRR
jgi:hypothetical protein